MREIKNKQLTNKVAIISSFIILLGIFFLSYNYVQAKRLYAYEYMNSLFEPKEEKIKKEPEHVSINTPIEEVKQEQPQQTVTNQYIGYLSIPKINFKKGFVDINSKDNNVDRNLFIVSTSSYPDVENGNLIIAGHSGIGYKAFFRNLYKLQVNDYAEVSYNGKVYTYKIKKIYEQPKTGKIAIYRDYNKTTLTLITCTENNDNTQTVYISELENVE